MKWKNKLIFLIFFLSAGLIIFRLYYIQIRRGEYFEALALGQQTFFKEVFGERGGIFLKDGTPLAQTAEAYLIYINPKQIEKDKEKIKHLIVFLSEILNENENLVRDKLFKNRVIKKEISYESFKKIRNARIKGVYGEKIWKRIYPQNKLAAQVVGFVNRNGDGQYGVERAYNSLLSGKKALRQEYRLIGFKRNSLRLKNPILLKGADVFLTIDYKLQYFAEKALEKAKERWKIESGQIIISEPATGKIITMAFLPRFDPNNYYKEKNLRVFVNPAVQSLFEPGSIFKAITFAAAIEEGLINPEDTYIDKGFVKLSGAPIYNFGRRAWGEQTMQQVLEKSLNTGAVFVQQKLGEKLFLSYLQKFGFFEKTGIKLESEVFSENRQLKKGIKRDIAVASFGQSINITPMQIIRAFGAIANGGKLMKPVIIDKIVMPDGEIKKEEPEMQRRVISKETSSRLIKMLVSVVENGSGIRGRIKGYAIAGKTGTAQVSVPGKNGYGGKTIQSFIGFFPAQNPRFLVFVKLDNPQTLMASRSAAPLFREIAEYIISQYELPPNEE